MATPQEIQAIWEAKKQQPVAANTKRPPTGYIVVNGERVAYWLPPGVSLFKPIESKRRRP